jgi:hypothetical protein
MEIKPPSQEQSKQITDLSTQMAEMMIELNRKMEHFKDAQNKLGNLGSAFTPIATKKVLVNGNEIEMQLMINGIVILKFAPDGKDAKFYFDTYK